MLRKFLVCCTPIVVLAMLAMPAVATVTVSYPAITHSWPAHDNISDSNYDGSRVLVNTMAGTIYGGDPNDLTSDQSPPYQRVGENFNDRAMQQTFSVPLDLNDPPASPYGLTLMHFVITAFGGGSAANLPISLHIYDMNQAGQYPVTPSIANYILSGGTGGGTIANNCMLPPGELLASSDSFIYRRDANANIPDTFVDFNFTGYDSFDLEPNHMYAFEIWPTKGDDPGWFWIRGTGDYVGGGLCYRVDPPSDYRQLTITRAAVASGTRTAVLGIYGIPCDSNAFHPTPRNLETSALLTTQLTWHAGRWSGPGADSNHMLYFSTNETAVRNRGSAARIGRLTDVNFTDPNEPNWKPPTGLVADTQYYWRVDEYNNVKAPSYWGRPGTGWWTFHTSGPQATLPSPTNNNQVTEFTPTNAWLSWTKGCYVGSADLNAHKVYFGTSFNDVNNATEANGTPLYRGPVTDPCYPLKNLAPDYTLTSGTTYYWRVDEVNATSGTSKGNTWNFTMPNPAYILLDNFGYQSGTDLAKVWQTGYQSNGGSNLSVAGNVMTMNYDNSGNGGNPGTGQLWSEAKLDYKYNGSTGVDWTLGGAYVPKALAVQFDAYGLDNTLNADANRDRLYMGIEDAAGNRGFIPLKSDPYAAQRQITITSGNAAVREFKVALNDPCFSGVDLTEVNRVYLGIGSKGSPYSWIGGSGVLRFANLKVYVQHCNPTYPTISAVAGDLAGPLSGTLAGDHSRYTPPDCVVNYHDISYFFVDWLFNEPNLVYDSNANPGTDNLEVWYKFDEGPGGPTDPCGLAILSDSSGNGRDANLYNPSPFTWAYTGHDGTGYCINLEPGYHTWIQCPNTVVINHGGQTGQSFTFWLKYNDSFEEEHFWASVLVFFRSPPGQGGFQSIETQLPDPYTPGQRAMPWTRWVDVRTTKETSLQKVRASSISSRWNHYALVLDTTDTSMRIYVNGVQIAGTIDTNETHVWGPNDTGDGNANSVRIGTRDNGTSRALSQFWQGRIDDLRLYSKALSVNEVQWLATDGTGKRNMQAVFIEPTNFVLNNTVTLPNGGPTVKIINFNDYATLAGYWLNQQLWP
ncbi:MAG: LamG-like jellyroll fold domain-containing protein [Sedimentisphaerales bacterium]